MASGIQLNSTNNSEMNIVYQGTSGAARTVVMPDRSFTVAGTDEVIGVGQTWQDVKASRAVGTTYTNTTGKPIMVNIVLTSSIDSYMSVFINGISVGYYFVLATRTGSSSIIVPSNATYGVTLSGGTTGISVWAELR